MTFFDDIKLVHQGIALTEQQMKIKTGYEFGMKYKWRILILTTIFFLLIYLSVWYSQVPGELLQVGVI